MKIIRQGDDNFEEEKLKMFEKEEVKVMSPNKEEQLRLVFRSMIANFLNSEFDVDRDYYNTQDNDIEILVNNLLTEVKIITKL